MVAGGFQFQASSEARVAKAKAILWRLYVSLYVAVKQGMTKVVIKHSVRYHSKKDAPKGNSEFHLLIDNMLD